MCQWVVLDFLIIKTFLNQERKRKYKNDYWRSVEKKTIYPTVVVPEGRNDNIGHAITVVDDLIFDSTQQHTLNFAENPLNGLVDFMVSKIYILQQDLNKMTMYPLWNVKLNIIEYIWLLFNDIISYLYIYKSV